MSKVNRNDLCPCGSGKKYKKCCALKEMNKKKKRFEGLKGVNLQMKKGETVMSSLANKVFTVITSTMTPAKRTLSHHSFKNKQEEGEHCHDSECGCHMSEEEALRLEEEERAKERGYRTLEDLIGVEGSDQEKKASHQEPTCH